MRLFLLTAGSFLLTVELFYLQLTILAFLLTVRAFLLTVGSFLTHSWSSFAYSGKVRLIRALRDCKQRSLTVSKKAPTLSKKASPLLFLGPGGSPLGCSSVSGRQWRLPWKGFLSLAAKKGYHGPLLKE